MINAECYLSFPKFSVGNLNYYEKPLRKTDSRVLLSGISSSTDPRHRLAVVAIPPICLVANPASS